jgi:hypothetical protein
MVSISNPTALAMGKFSVSKELDELKFDVLHGLPVHPALRIGGGVGQIPHQKGLPNFQINQFLDQFHYLFVFHLLASYEDKILLDVYGLMIPTAPAAGKFICIHAKPCDNGRG